MGTYVQQLSVKQRIAGYVRNFWSNTARTYGGFADKIYYLPDHQEFSDILEQNPVFENPHLGEGFDCDDYSFVLKGSFSLYAKRAELKASICLGIAWGFFDWRQDFHSCNWILLEDFSFYWVEPINKSLHRINECSGGLRLMLV